MALPTSFTSTWVSPMLSAPFSIFPTFTLDPLTNEVSISIPSFTVATNPMKAVYGLIAPGNSTFPSQLQFTTPTQTALTTMDLGFGAVAATLTLYPDGSMAVAPNYPAYTSPSSITVGMCTLTYIATATPITLAYGVLSPIVFSGIELPSGVSTSVYYSTDGTNVILCVPSLTFGTNHTASNALTSTTNLPASGPNLIPLMPLSQSTNGQSYKSGLVTPATFNISNIGSMSFVVPGSLPTNSHSCFGYFIGHYTV